MPSEVILVEDHSDDGTEEFLEEIQRSYPEGWVRIVRMNRNAGPSAARNVGWNNAAYPLLAFLDADDMWYPRKVALQVWFMQDRPEICLHGHGFNVGRTADEDSGCEAHDLSGREVGLSSLLMRNPLCTSTVMLRTAIPHRFDISMRYSEDYALWLDIVSAGGRCAVSRDVLAYRRQPAFGASGLSGNLWAMQRGEMGNYARLRASGKLGALMFVCLVLFSWVRFGRRTIITFCRSVASRAMPTLELSRSGVGSLLHALARRRRWKQ